MVKAQGSGRQYAIRGVLFDDDDLIYMLASSLCLGIEEAVRYLERRLKGYPI